MCYIELDLFFKVPYLLNGNAINKFALNQYKFVLKCLFLFMCFNDKLFCIVILEEGLKSKWKEIPNIHRPPFPHKKHLVEMSPFVSLGDIGGWYRDDINLWFQINNVIIQLTSWILILQSHHDDIVVTSPSYQILDLVVMCLKVSTFLTLNDYLSSILFIFVGQIFFPQTGKCFFLLNIVTYNTKTF